MYIYTYICILTCTCIQTYTYMYVHTCLPFLLICVSVCVRACKYDGCIYMWHVCICMHTCMHTQEQSANLCSNARAYMQIGANGFKSCNTLQHTSGSATHCKHCKTLKRTTSIHAMCVCALVCVCVSLALFLFLCLFLSLSLSVSFSVSASPSLLPSPPLS